mmetsp:Transcript_1817/g.1712  ORF Transcript_1817/g.1712 Transcript_1817/m.1712 type:complete len:130 (-) Transcript_1817:585-974(-)
MNKGIFEMSSIDDSRILVQSVLDFFELFAAPAISNRFIDAIDQNIHTDKKLSKNVQESFFKSLDKKEFLLIEVFVRFFALIDQMDHTISEFIDPAITRLCIALLCLRKTEDTLFSGRDMVSAKAKSSKV